MREDRSSYNWPVLPAFPRHWVSLLHKRAINFQTKSSKERRVRNLVRKSSHWVKATCTYGIGDVWKSMAPSILRTMFIPIASNKS